MTRSCRRRCGAVSAVVVLSVASAAPAVVEVIDATVRAEAVERVEGLPPNTDAAFEDLVETSGRFPLVVDVGFERPDADGEASSVIALRASVTDPRLPEGPDPEELGIVGLAVSHDPAVTHIGHSVVTEAREVVFQPDEVRAAAGTDIRAYSHFFLDGVLVIAGELASAGGDPTLATCLVTVTRDDMDGSPPQVLMSQEIRLFRTADGTGQMTLSGPLKAENVVFVSSLPESPDDMASLYAVVIPRAAIPYEYRAVVGRRFRLTARAEVRLANESRTSACVMLGLPLEDLEGILGELQGGTIPPPPLDLLRPLVEAAGPPAEPLRAAFQGTRIQAEVTPLWILPWPGCGSLGFEALAVLLVAPLCGLMRRAGGW